VLPLELAAAARSLAEVLDRPRITNSREGSAGH